MSVNLSTLKISAKDICKVNAVKVIAKEVIPRLVNGLKEKLDAKEKTIVNSPMILLHVVIGKTYQKTKIKGSNV